MNKVLYFNCQSGISGDMTVAALLDLGLDQDELRQQLGLLNLNGYKIEIGRRDVGGISACDFDVVLTEHEHAHRNLSIIEEIIGSSGLMPEVKELSIRIFRRLAEAEAAVHGVPIEEIHFHEVGAIDSIIDIVATAICVVMLGVDGVQVSPLPFGSGYTKCAHGSLPVPVPATVEIMKGAPVYQTDIQGELVTPTGAAIARTLADRFGPLPSMRISAVGYGSGKREYERPNFLRVFLGTVPSINDVHEEDLVLLETNIDDMNPEMYSCLVPLLMQRGALDTYLTHVIMKKGRPGILLSVLCRPEDQAAMEETVFLETTTLGIRRQVIRRCALRREILTIDTRFGPVKAKAAYSNGKLLRITSEYEECRRIATERGLSIQEVYGNLMQDFAAMK